MSLALPNSVRYIKNGANGRWWKTAKADKQIHAQWDVVDNDLLKQTGNDLLKQNTLKLIEGQIRTHFGKKVGAATQDFRALETLLVKPSQHVWVTFEDGYMWW